MKHQGQHVAARPRRPRALIALAGLGTLLLVLALGFQLNERLDNPPQAAPAPVPSAAPLSDGFAQSMRDDLPTLDIALGNEQLANEAQQVCDALAAAPVPEVYATHELPVTDQHDAARFMGAAVVWKCPQHSVELSQLIAP